jgi:hypothetical protein
MTDQCMRTMGEVREAARELAEELDADEGEVDIDLARGLAEQILAAAEAAMPSDEPDGDEDEDEEVVEDEEDCDDDGGEDE